jgi:hypothetical protein
LLWQPGSRLFSSKLPLSTVTGTTSPVAFVAVEPVVSVPVEPVDCVPVELDPPELASPDPAVDVVAFEPPEVAELAVVEAPAVVASPVDESSPAQADTKTHESVREMSRSAERGCIGGG